MLGPSGSGKTSLLNLLVGYERAAAGRVLFQAMPTSNPLPVFWAPPQQGLWPHLSVREHLTTVSSKSDAPRIEQLLREFDLLDHAEARPDTLSLGERSRLNAARAICSRAGILVMDEPLSHVDSARSGKYWDVIRHECGSIGASLVFSTHSPDVVLREAGHVICLNEGSVSYSGGVNELYERPASPELAALLGPCNWMTSGQLTRWCQRNVRGESALDSDVLTNNDEVAERAQAGHESEQGQCYRPERLQVLVAADSPFTVQATRFAGVTEEVDLRDERSGESRRFVCRSVGAIRCRGGDRVILKLLFLLMVALLPGCWKDLSPSLVVKHESNWMMPPEGPRVPAPRGITVSPDNEYLVLDNAGRVLVYNESGDVTRQWWMPDYSVGKAEGICVLKDGRIAVADTHYHRVVFFDHDGNVTSMFGQRGSGPGDFVYPVGICQDPDENIYICEYGQNDRVQKFRPDGTYLLEFGGPGTEPGQFQRPSGIAWFDHRLYVVDAFNNRIQSFEEDGKLVAILGDSDKISEVYYPYDITVDQNGDLYVVEYGAGRVSKFTRQGRLLGRYGRSGNGETKTQFSTPWGLTIDRRGRLYVCDTGNRRIVELEL